MKKIVLVVYNPISGAGRSMVEAHLCAEALQKKKREVLVEDSTNISKIDWSKIKLVIVAGGDGTMLRILPFAIEYDLPVAMYPSGNQCLFARQFGYTKNVNRLVEIVEQENLSEHYLGEANGQLFFCMLSVGFDSEVVKRICDKRKGPINFLTYPLPTITSLFSHRAPCLRVSVDGKIKINSQVGYLVVGNNKQYALGLKVIPEADSQSEKFAIRFIPCSSAGELFRNSWKGLWQGQWAGFPAFFGQEIKIESAENPFFPVQADGDFFGKLPLFVRKHPKRLRVMIA